MKAADAAMIEGALRARETFLVMKAVTGDLTLVEDLITRAVAALLTAYEYVGGDPQEALKRLLEEETQFQSRSEEMVL